MKWLVEDTKQDVFSNVVSEKKSGWLVGERT